MHRWQRQHILTCIQLNTIQRIIQLFNFISVSPSHISAIDKAYCDKNESQKYAKAKGLKSHVFIVIPNVLFQEVFSDFCDGSGFLPKARVGDAVRCLGENPLQSEVAHHHEKRGRVSNET